jgi:hypothetical protein
MLAMMSRPPYGTALAGGASQRCHHESDDPAGVEGAVREVAVVERGNEEHP